MTGAKKADQLKLLGIWLPPEEKRQIKIAAASREMTLNQAVRQALREWIAHSVVPSASPRAGVPQPGAKSVRETAPANAAPARQAVSAVPAKPLQPGATPAARAQASGSTRKGKPGQGAAARAHSGPAFAWLRGAAGLDWSACRAVESRGAQDGSRVWVFRGTQVTLKKVFRLLQEGHASAKVGRRFQLDPQIFEEVLRFAAQRLAPFLPGAR